MQTLTNYAYSEQCRKQIHKKVLLKPVITQLWFDKNDNRKVYMVLGTPVINDQKYVCVIYYNKFFKDKSKWNKSLRPFYFRYDYFIENFELIFGNC